MAEKETNHTSIYTGPQSEMGRLLRLAATFMPNVEVGARGWASEVIRNALIAFVEGHAPDRR